VELSGSDPAGFLGVTGIGSYDVNDEDGSGTLSLSVRRWWPTFSLFGGYYRNSLSAVLDDDVRDYQEDDWYLSSTVSFPFPDTEFSVSLYGGYTFERFTGGITGPWEYDPGGLEPYIPTQGNLGTLFAGFSYGDTETWTWSVTTEKGNRVNGELRWSTPYVGSNWTEWQVRYGASRFLPMPWADHHVLALQAKGGYAWGREEFMRTFSAGGYPPQDVLMDLLYGSSLGGTYLRGYPPSAIRGRQYYFGVADYYFPLWRIRRGWQTWPVFLKDLYVDLFGNAATAFDEAADAQVLIGAGGELRLKLLLAYYQPFSVIIGAAYGFSVPGGFTTYFLLGD
jgi:hypothetical protein